MGRVVDTTKRTDRHDRIVVTPQRRIRPAGRVIILDPTHACLLAHVISTDGTWLFTPGGGVHGDEDTLAAARREVAEETSLHLDELVGPVLFRRAHFTFLGRDIEARETFWVARVPTRTTVVASRLDDYERDILGDWRWLTADELRASPIPVYPHCLPDLLQVLATSSESTGALDGGLPWVEQETADGLHVAIDEDIPTWVDR